MAKLEPGKLDKEQTATLSQILLTTSRQMQLGHQKKSGGKKTYTPEEPWIQENLRKFPIGFAFKIYRRTKNQQVRNGCYGNRL